MAVGSVEVWCVVCVVCVVLWVPAPPEEVDGPGAEAGAPSRGWQVRPSCAVCGVICARSSGSSGSGALAKSSQRFRKEPSEIDETKSAARA